ncbi:MAG: hypothetical protein A2X11_06205 [Bacteroidetes bacterium GWE2_42_24]|nr:MAG: hypothetical protein A2X11_06205 [Bacteroidetes bacterium GWE2_42_24]OFY28193.1 MAG: hypothetical protein A2X09_15295 [Bacteroidetes bacterium GWF2_43_11]
MEPRLRLLIIEDDPTSAKLMQITLNRLGYEVVGIAPNGQAAIELTKETSPDLLLMDINLPGQFDGIETARIINQKYDIPVIYVTANTEDETIKLAIATNPIGYLVKPYSREHLKTMVEMGFYKHKLENELKKNQEMLSVTLENIADGVLMVQSNGNILFHNDATIKILNLEEENLSGTSIFSLFPNISIDAFDNTKGKSFQSAGVITYTDVQWSSDNGLSLILEQQITKIQNAIDDASTYVITFRDITARRMESIRLVKIKEELEERVEVRTLEIRMKNLELERENKIRVEAEKELKEALVKQKDLTNFQANIVTTVSHEFRTPLTTIQSSAELIERNVNKGSEPDGILKHVGQIRNSVTTLTALLNDVLLVEKMNASKLEVTLESLSPESFFQCLADEYKIGTGRNHVLEYQHNVFPSEINIDRKLLGHIVNNLMSNAFKYSPVGSTVMLVVFIGDNLLKIIVKDQGIGISESNVQYVFDTFYREPSAVNIEGTGVGLAILKESVDLMGGTIQVDSKKGHGTTFTVSIPL